MKNNYLSKTGITGIFSPCSIARAISLLVFFLLVQKSLFAQMVLKSETFDAVQFPPFGWLQGKVGAGSDPDNYWERATNAGGMQPGIAGPFAGAGMARYRSDMTNAGEASFFASPRYDLTNNPGTATVSFRMYRDNSSTLWDSLVVYANNIPDPASGIPFRLGMIPRYYNWAPAGAINSWQAAPYSFTLPSTVPYLTSSFYIVFVGYSRLGSNIYIDEFEIQTYPKQQTLASAGLNYQETSDVGKATTNQVIVGVKLTTDGAQDPLRLDSLTFNPNGTTSLADITNAKLWYTGTSNQYLTTTQVGATVPAPNFVNMKFIPAALYLENGDNYFWLSYDIPLAAVSGNCVDADLANAFSGSGVYITDTTGVDVSSSPAASPQTLVGCRQIDVSYCAGVLPTYVWGTSWAGYTNNDYVAEVDLIGAPLYPIIDNAWNNNGPFMPVTPTPFSAHPPDYEQFLQPGTVLTPGNKITTALYQGSPYSITLKVGTWFSSNCITAWIDYNKDGDWNDNFGGPALDEALAGQGQPAQCLAGSGSYTYNFTVPPSGSGVITGNTRLRVREVWITPGMTPCQSGYGYGEIEDYTITILPNCNPLYKLWLGYTDDWNTPNNWCGGVPTINDVAIVDFAMSGGAGYLRPVIHAGTNATAKTIRIGPLDTLWINGPNTSSLTVADSLSISYRPPATGSLRVISAYNDTSQISNGNTVRTFIMPFRGGIREQRLQMIYSKAEMLARGFQPGDIIDAFRFHFSAKTAATTYQNLTISYYYTNITCFTPPTPIPAPVGAAGGTVFVSASLTIPFPLPGMSYTVTFLPNTFVWNPPVGNDHLVVQLCWDNLAAPPVGDQQLCTQTVGCNSTIYFYHNTNSATGACALTQAAANGSGMFDFRPNITFLYHRPYVKYPIYMGDGPAYGKGDWINNGSFVAGYSRVTFRGDSIANQSIGGTVSSLFDELEINKTVANVQLDINTTVGDSLVLTNGPLLLNSRTLSLTYASPAAATRTNGYLVSEDQPSLGRLAWTINTSAGTYNFPFGTPGGTYIPFELTNTGGANNLGIVDVSTYGTPMNNTVYPPGVIHVNNQSGAPNDGSLTVDRFWVLNKSGAGTATNVTFNFTIPEISTGGLTPWPGASSNLVAQRWLGSGWQPGLGSAVAPVYAGTNRVNSGSLTANFNGPWTHTLTSNPLPIELLHFSAELINDKVKVYWSTASEIDNDYFLVDRSSDLNEYDFISMVDSRGPGSSLLRYETYDEQPMKGINYYRLTSVDIDGDRYIYTPVAVEYLPSAFDISNVYHLNSDQGILQVEFITASDQKVKIMLLDVNGRTVYSADYNAKEGFNTVQVNARLTSGIYNVSLQNESERKTRNVLY